MKYRFAGTIRKPKEFDVHDIKNLLGKTPCVHIFVNNKTQQNL